MSVQKNFPWTLARWRTPGQRVPHSGVISEDILVCGSTDWGGSDCLLASFPSSVGAKLKASWQASSLCDDHLPDLQNMYIQQCRKQARRTIRTLPNQTTANPNMRTNSVDLLSTGLCMGPAIKWGFSTGLHWCYTIGQQSKKLSCQNGWAAHEAFCPTSCHIFKKSHRLIRIQA